MLLIDANNAFNALNRQAALHNIQVQCPIIATYAINTYRLSARLFITAGQEILSSEGPTQGDPLAMGLYTLASILSLLDYKGHVRSSSASLLMMPVEQALSQKSRGGGTT